MLRKSKINRDILLSLFIISCGVMMAIGRFYDERLALLGINFSIIFSSIFMVLFFSVLFLFKSTKIDLNKILLYIFYCFLIISSLILWIIYGVTDYGLVKFFNLVLIPLPISLVIIEKFNNRDRDLMINILLGISVLLLLFTFFSLSTLSSTRSGVLGGGPIVLSRWLCFGAVVVLFHPRIKRFKVIYILLFLFAALFTGSRGPIFSIFLVMILYFFFNFRKVFFRTIILLSFLISILFFTGIFDQLLQYNNVSRVFMNIGEGGFNKPNNRSYIFESSIQEIISYPLGVGSGNFVEYTEDPSFFKNKDLFYPHNLFFEILCEFGIITFLVFMIYLLQSLLSFKINLFNKRETRNMMFYSFAFLFFNSMVSGDLNDARLLFVFIPLMLVKENE
ncbi:MAG: O-antigen ligase family protein [Flavobacteriales bacterium]|nr:O-antigen ligase family protein [Flavobacteriales bacterium]MBT5699204.1 O-antigen ligase family protein [Flavobacteriales bacterium]MBT7726725.1 O-antigen ligase family protein [Flavobacteriales bacterium]